MCVLWKALEWLFYMYIFRDALMSLFDTYVRKTSVWLFGINMFRNKFRCLFDKYVFRNALMSLFDTHMFRNTSIWLFAMYIFWQGIHKVMYIFWEDIHKVMYIFWEHIHAVIYYVQILGIHSYGYLLFTYSGKAFMQLRNVLYVSRKTFTWFSKRNALVSERLHISLNCLDLL